MPLPCDHTSTPGNPFHTIGRIKGLLSFPLNARSRGVTVSEQYLWETIERIAAALEEHDAERGTQWDARLTSYSNKETPR